MEQKKLGQAMRTNKKGVSVMIEYVLLVVIVISISSISYVWMKSYVPAEDLECQDGVSVYISNMNCSYTGNSSISITLKNSGRFTVRGFFIRGTNEPDQKLATLDLSKYLTEKNKILSNEITFENVDLSASNTFLPTKEKTFTFKDIPGKIYSIEIIPTRIEEIEGNPHTASCSNAKINEEISCN